MDNFEIDKVLKDDDSFRGCFMKDQLPDKLELGSFIINLESSTQGDGTHWTCLYNRVDPETKEPTSYFFDSFGVCPSIEVYSIMYPRFEWNRHQFQAIKSKACGWFCCFFINLSKWIGNFNAISCCRFSFSFRKQCNYYFSFRL